AAAADRGYALCHVLEHVELALRNVVVARHAHRLDQPDAELARNNCGGHEAAARHADDRLEWPGAGEPPGERARVAMELIPRDRKRLLRLWLELRLRLWTRLSHPLPRNRKRAF